MSSELGHIARHTGDREEASKIYCETIKGWQDLGNRAAIAHQLECFGLLTIADEEIQHTLKLFGAAEALRERIQSPMTDQEYGEYEQAVAHIRFLLPETEFRVLWAEGRSMSMEQAIELALTNR